MRRVECYLYIAILSSFLVVPIRLVLRTLLALQERVIVPILRVHTASGETRTVTFRRTPLRSHQIDPSPRFSMTAPAKFTQPGRTL